MTTATSVSFLGISPYLYYEDGAAALEWLERVFGFREDVRYLNEKGIVAEAEILAGDTRIMIGGKAPGPDEGRGQLLVVFVDDVEAQYARVIAAGVEAGTPADMPYGPRVFEVTDPWGYRWSFWQMVRDDVELPDGWTEIRC
jgi:uncharacterized glyoxalase superfamily protein PhnB